MAEPRRFHFRRALIALLIPVALLACAILLFERMTWRMQLESNAIMVGHYFAKDAFARGELILYEADFEGDDTTFTGRVEDGFEIWTWPVPNGFLSSAMRTSESEIIRSFNRAMRNYAAKGEPPYAAIIEKQSEILKSERVGSRHDAVRTLSRLGTRVDGAIPALAKAVEDDDVFVRLAAIQALAEIGPGAQEALSALQEARDDTDATVRRNAEQAIEAISNKLGTESQN